MNLEEKLMQMDFYKFSKVQESLLQKINERRARDIELLDMEELDYVAAAGTRPTKDFQPNIKVTK